jgi:AmmeMemoRadiSam system protein B
MSQDDPIRNQRQDAGGRSSPQRLIRQPVMAGRFYPADSDDCRRLVEQYLSDRQPADVRSSVLPSAGMGAIVPHAGWICSGAVAGRSIAALSAGRQAPPDVVVIFAAIHSPGNARRALFCSAGAWRTPLGDVGVREDLQVELLREEGLFEINDYFHAREHAVEVELPLVQAAWPGASILPVEVPVIRRAADIGRATAAAVKKLGLDAVYLASSDLTHYGPMYDFAPAGIGLTGLEWAKQNDRKLLVKVESLAAEEIVPQVIVDQSACGPGAIAATIAACVECGATKGRVLQHTNSYETLAEVHPQPASDAVGYASVVIE